MKSYSIIFDGYTDRYGTVAHQTEKTTGDYHAKDCFRSTGTVQNERYIGMQIRGFVRSIRDSFSRFSIQGLRQNRISTHDFISQNDRRKKLCNLGDCENETPTHMSATHAISKLK